MKVSILKANAGEYEQFREFDCQVTWDNIPEAERLLLDRESYSESFKKGLARIVADSSAQLFVAKTDDHLQTGYVLIGDHYNTLTTKTEAWIYAIFVFPEFQHKGIGKQLLQFAEEYSLERGFGSLGLLVASHNRKARSFYEKEGYATTSCIVRKNLQI